MQISELLNMQDPGRTVPGSYFQLRGCLATLHIEGYTVLVQQFYSAEIVPGDGFVVLG